MNFNQWRNYAAKKDVAKVTYICGEQSALIELVLEDIKEILQVPATDYVSVDGSEDIWSLASQYPLDPNSNRLVVVRNADAIVESWSELSGWLAQSRSNPKNYLVFVANQSDAPAVFSKGKRVGYLEHVELIRTKGKLIKCSQPNEEDLIKWCESYNLSKAGAEFLVQRTAGDVAAMLGVLKKVKIWNGAPNPKALELFCSEQVSENLADCLILLDKKAALLTLDALQPQDYGRIVSRLDSRLDMMLDIHRCLLRRMYDNDIAANTGINIFLVKKFKRVAKDYELNKIKQRRQLITMVDKYLQSGATTGVMESLISLW